ncbi:hypothetical protein ACFVVU_18450 [Kitasatospora sp. NPDC057965]|uniref:hypothetical protein n=1 Tax=Kitasatospora sp. NPDC057965 TaxID=3346291 RepID=UPI0036DF2E8A
MSVNAESCRPSGIRATGLRACDEKDDYTGQTWSHTFSTGNTCYNGAGPDNMGAKSVYNNYGYTAQFFDALGNGHRSFPTVGHYKYASFGAYEGKAYSFRMDR